MSPKAFIAEVFQAVDHKDLPAGDGARLERFMRAMGWMDAPNIHCSRILLFGKQSDTVRSKGLNLCDRASG